MQFGPVLGHPGTFGGKKSMILDYQKGKRCVFAQNLKWRLTEAIFDKF